MKSLPELSVTVIKYSAILETTPADRTCSTSICSDLTSKISDIPVRSREEEAGDVTTNNVETDANSDPASSLLKTNTTNRIMITAIIDKTAAPPAMNL